MRLWRFQISNLISRADLGTLSVCRHVLCFSFSSIFDRWIDNLGYIIWIKISVNCSLCMSTGNCEGKGTLFMKVSKMRVKKLFRLWNLTFCVHWNQSGLLFKNSFEISFKSYVCIQVWRISQEKYIPARM